MKIANMGYVTKITLPINKLYPKECSQRKSNEVRLKFVDERKCYNKYLNFLL